MLPRRGFWLSYLDFNCPLITRSLALTFSNVSAELSNSHPTPLSLQITICSTSQIPHTLGHLALPLPSLPLVDVFTLSLLPYIRGSLYFTCHRNTILTASQIAGDLAPKFHNKHLLSQTAPHINNSSLELQKANSEMKIRIQALILMLSGLIPDPDSIIQNNIILAAIK